MIPTATQRRIWLDASGSAILPLATFAIVVLMIVPVPSIVLDVGFIANIALSLAVLMIALNAARPLDFSSFPTVLLFATLLRLALNVASTRVVLVSGHEGPGAAGHVIEAFGKFLIGGDWAVGIFVFLILMIINLVVITKGAGRVSEVSARFTLDALPGKQMAIDADLNAGLMTADEAKVRRQEVATEADFYGSMDGASKFVKGDAVAGVLILVINIVGGMVLGILSHGLSASEAAKTYVLLAIGDALVAQVPALLLSIAAAAIVTRVSSTLDLARQVTSQFAGAATWAPVAAILGVLGLLPGMPHFIILPAAAGAGLLAWQLNKKPDVIEIALPQAAPSSAIEWSDVHDSAALSLDIGYALVGLVDERKGAPLMARITGIRRQLSRELGFVVPLVRVRDELSLSPNRYRITLSGIVVGEDDIYPDDLLALDSGDIEGVIEGRAVKDPTFGLDALWISTALRSDAIVAGYTVVDAPTVIATHLNRMIVGGAADLFGIDEAQKLLDSLRETSPELVKGLTPATFTTAMVAGLCRGLLADGVPLKDFRRIAEAMIESGAYAANPRALLEAVRARIGALIVQTIVPSQMPLPAITLASDLEGLLADAVRIAPEAAHPFEPGLSARVTQAICEAAAPMLATASGFAIVTSPSARTALARLLRPHLPETPVLSFLEIPDAKAVDVVAVVGRAEALPHLPEGAA
jgi:flagellar biosynthesis protein FlhA